MDFKEGLLTRRSIRKFEKSTVSQAEIEDILKIAMYAPSAKNLQPWEFVVISEPKALAEIKAFHPYTSFIEEAGQAILVCGDVAVQHKEGNWVTDASAATQNILYACHEKGLGAVWCGIFPDADFMTWFEKKFELPEHIKPLSLVIFGKIETGFEARQPSTRFKPEKIHWQKW
ncbi:MAG: nitroreductase family protein [Alphaproteobacteria bacterium]|nr:nitroreductase family protein [Alphaproteobacteria bacterium]